jgi:hypothetical protein
MDSFLAAVSQAPCDGEPFGCPRKVTGYVVSLVDPGQGLHSVAPMTLKATCRRHRRKVRRAAVVQAIKWPGVWAIRPDEVPELLRWFHEESGLCAGPRAVSVATPGWSGDRATLQDFITMSERGGMVTEAQARQLLQDLSAGAPVGDVARTMAKAQRTHRRRGGRSQAP